MKLQEAEENINLKKLENVELLEKGKIDVAEFNRREKSSNATKYFLESKLKQVEHDLFICNKNKYDLIKYIAYWLDCIGKHSNINYKLITIISHTQTRCCYCILITMHTCISLYSLWNIKSIN